MTCKFCGVNHAPGANGCSFYPNFSGEGVPDTNGVRKLVLDCVLGGDPVATYVCGMWVNMYNVLPHQSTDSRSPVTTDGLEAL